MAYKNQWYIYVAIFIIIIILPLFSTIFATIYQGSHKNDFPTAYDGVFDRLISQPGFYGSVVIIECFVAVLAI